MMDTFDREKLKKLIDRVNVYAEDEIEIIWKPMDVIFNGIAADKTSINISRKWKFRIFVPLFLVLWAGLLYLQMV